MSRFIKAHKKQISNKMEQTTKEGGALRLKIPVGNRRIFPICNPCNYYIVQTQAECPAFVHETVCVQADIAISPSVDVGDIESYCVGGPVIGACSGTPSPTNTCTFSVSQSICVQIPLTFSAQATAVPTGIVCGLPISGSCPSSAACTYTIGYYLTRPAVTNALIELAGGSVVLGIDGAGASFTVTATNADAVLSLHTPSPPAPASQPYAGQYQILYAQLLAANLNILSGALCGFAVDAIAAANSFLATSPSGIGKDGAPAMQILLKQFNEGTAPGCPGHCP